MGRSGSRVCGRFVGGFILQFYTLVFLLLTLFVGFYGTRFALFQCVLLEAAVLVGGAVTAAATVAVIGILIVGGRMKEASQIGV